MKKTIIVYDPKPTHRLFLCCSNVPTEQEMGEAGKRIKSLLGKLKFPFRFDPLGGGEVQRHNQPQL